MYETSSIEVRKDVLDGKTKMFDVKSNRRLETSSKKIVCLTERKKNTIESLNVDIAASAGYSTECGVLTQKFVQVLSET